LIFQFSILKMKILIAALFILNFVDAELVVNVRLTQTSVGKDLEFIENNRGGSTDYFELSNSIR